MESNEARSPRPAFHFAWVVAGITFLVLLVSSGVRSMPGVLIVPLEEQFGWTRATISWAVSVNLMLYGLVGPFAAALMSTFGVRRTVVTSLVVVSTGVALTTFMTELWQLVLLWGVVVGCGTGMTALVLGATVVNRWFVERRGLVLGALTASAATGQLVFLPLFAVVVKDLGWRSAVMTVAAVSALVVPLVLLCLRDRPSDIGARPYGAADDFQEASTAPGNPFVAAIDGCAMECDHAISGCLRSVSLFAG